MATFRLAVEILTQFVFESAEICVPKRPAIRSQVFYFFSSSEYPVHTP
jgi:hypothetical protein